MPAPESVDTLHGGGVGIRAEAGVRYEVPVNRANRLAFSVLAGGQDAVVHVTTGPRSSSHPVSAHQLRAIDLQLPIGAATAEIQVDTSDALVFALEAYQAVQDPTLVVLIFMDTVRADRMSVYGYDRATTPNLETWASSAVVFERAYTIAPWTLPAARAMLSGVSPDRWPSATSLPERLGAAGFSTMAVWTNVNTSAHTGMVGGFDAYSYNVKEPAEAVTDRALGWLDAFAHRDAFFLLQYMDAHQPLQEPEEYRGRWEGSAPPDIGPDEWRDVGPAHPSYDQMVNHQRGRYDQALLYLDAELGRLLEALPTDALVVVVSDHGEELWEHGEYEHGHAFWEQLMRVPLLVRGAGLRPERRRDLASVTDLTPTVLNLVDVPFESLEGRDLMSGKEPSAISFGWPVRGPDGWGMVNSRWKWWSRPDGEVAYDLVSDPAEVTPLPGREDLRDLFEASHHSTLVAGCLLEFAGGPSALDLELHGVSKDDVWIVGARQPRDGFIIGTSGATHVKVEEGADAVQLFVLGSALGDRGLTLAEAPDHLHHLAGASSDCAETGTPEIVWEGALGDRHVRVSRVWQPVTRSPGTPLPNEPTALRLLGYVDSEADRD